MSQDSVKFIHVRRFVDVATVHDSAVTGLDCKGGTTIAYTVTAVGEGETLLTYNVAHCSPKDNYCRATGRAVARGRLLSSKNPTSNVMFSVAETQHPVASILQHAGLVESDEEPQELMAG